MERIFNFKIYTIVILLLSMSVYGAIDCNKQSYLLLELHYKDGLITYLDHSTKVGCAPGSLKAGNFKIEVLDKDKLIYSSMFQDPSKMFVDVGENNKISGGLVDVGEKKFYLAVPAVEEANVKIYNNENVQVLNADIQSTQSVTRSRNVGLFGWVEDLLRNVSALLK